MSLRIRKPIRDSILEGSESEDSKIQRRRWRMAYRAIYFTRVLVSLTKKLLDRNNRLLSHSLSYIAIDVGIENPASDNQSLLGVDKRVVSELVREKNLEGLTSLGGVQQLVQVLESDPKRGVRDDEAEIVRRKNLFGENRYGKRPLKSFLSFVFESLKDTTIVILLACAVLALGFGIKQEGLKDGWYDGGSIILAVFLVVVVSSVSNFKQNRQFERLSDESSDIEVEVVRDGKRRFVSIFDIVVGDVVFLKIGDQVPADGLFLEGYSIKVDESSLTGESDYVEIDERRPFLVSGTKVNDGYGVMVVTSVGMDTAWGKMMSVVSKDSNEETPLQARLNVVTSHIGKIGLAVAGVVLVVMLIRYFTGNTRDEMGNREFVKGLSGFNDVMNSVVGIVSAAVTIVVVAIPEGLPLAVTLTLAFSMKKMMKDNALVRKLSACETMGSATMICTDKTGTLTLNQMQVTEFWLGKEVIQGKESWREGLNVFELLQEGVGLNTIGSVFLENSASVPEITGSPTEKAILSWAAIDLGMDVNASKERWEIIQVEAFNSEKKRSGVLVRKTSEKGIVHMHWKGAAEMIVAMCVNYYNKTWMIVEMDDEERRKIEGIIKDMAAKSLRCIAFAYKSSDSEAVDRIQETGFTLLGIIGLKDPCRPGVREAVDRCRNAGVGIKMITGDNVYTAKAIAIECGILNPDEDLSSEAVVEGIEFRSYTSEERINKIENIRVMARSSPFDKLLMVQTLKQLGHVVAVTGDGTNDAPALKEADIGLSMGIQGTEVAKESSDIVILDDNFASVVTVLRWGRCVYNNIQKFLQFQLTVNAAALVINIVAAVSSGKVPLTAVQLLWVNLIMDTLGALALATEQPTNELMKRAPVGRSKPIITRIMWRNLIAQAVFQVIVLLTLQFRGRSILHVSEAVKNTMIFNTFVLCQVFNEFNARELEKKNVFKGIMKNKVFIGIVGVTIVLQVAMVEFLKKFADTERLNWGQWGVCIGIAVMSWPIGFLFKCLPVSDK